MTWEEIIKQYLRLFILVIETAGDQTSNDIYKDVAKFVDSNQDGIQNLINTGGIPFENVVVYLSSLVVLNVHGDRIVSDSFGSEDFQEKAELGKDLVVDIYKRYLAGPTEKFLKKNGLPPIGDNIEEHVSTIFCKEELK